MSFFLLLYIVVAVSLISIGIIAIRKYGKYVYGKYFFLFTLFYFLWLLLYIFSFTIVYENDVLLILCRLMYGLAFVGQYLSLFVVIFYNNKDKSLLSKKHLPIIGGLFISFLVIVFTTFIIKGLIYSEELNLSYEDLGKGYYLYTLSSLILPLLISIFAYFKMKTLNKIGRLRFKYILSGILFLISSELIFLVILPMFDIWIFQKEQILFFIPFILLSGYSIPRFHFINFRYSFSRFLIFLLSIFLSVIFILIIKKYFSDMVSDDIIHFWSYENAFGITESITAIIVFLIVHKIIKKILFGNNIYENFQTQLIKIQDQIPYITNINELNNFLLLKFSKLFKINHVGINIFDYKSFDTEIYRFFSKNELNNLFINDIVFIEENKYKFNYEKISREISEDIILILPIKDNNRKIIGTFYLGNQIFKDYYTSEQIGYLKDFVNYIEGHLKYLKIYERINELNLDLDKMVDEKTIEYNNLINKQKEFIDVISHEIKGPIASSLLQGECILDDIKELDGSNKELENDMKLLNKELMKTGSLANKLFDISSYDIKKISLYKQKVNIVELIEEQVEIYIKNNKNIDFSFIALKDIPVIRLDKVQFTQVIDNLLTNAIKFSNKNNGKISVELSIKNNILKIKIEDNGEGIKKYDMENIFDKYSTGKVNGIGLGMGLYLCKRIVELHGGKINASLSKKMGGAMFKITLPVKNG